ncbi:LOW QUALITY PROTEIN: proline-serine-threonine phosphatase-interacting protein 2 [Pluvialis apricaria]
MVLLRHGDKPTGDGQTPLTHTDHGGNMERRNFLSFLSFLNRAIIEEKYGKELINLLKEKPGQLELNTLKRSLDVFKQPIDNVGQGHIQLAQTLREKAKEMEDFREKKQKLHCKKIELIMEAIHKNRNLQYKTMEAKRLYEQRCRDKDEAEPAVHQRKPGNANLVTQKQQEKLFLKLAQSKSALEDSDRSYQQSVTTLENREEWQKEHIKACKVFETQECERINYFRNALWLYVNQLSQDCVQNDEGQVLLPIDIKTLLELVLSPTMYMLWREKWKDKLEVAMLDNVNRPPGDPLRFATLDMLTGSGQYADGATQAALDPRVTQQTQALALAALEELPNLGTPVPPYSQVKQGVGEPYMQFIDRLKASIDAAPTLTPEAKKAMSEWDRNRSNDAIYM